MNFRNSILAVLVIAGAAALAASSGLEIVYSEGYSGVTVTRADSAPLGSYVEAVVSQNGQEMVVDTAPVNPGTGTAAVFFPPIGELHKVVLRDPGGVFLASIYVDGLEFD